MMMMMIMMMMTTIFSDDTAFRKLSDLVSFLEHSLINNNVDGLNAKNQHRRSVNDTNTERNQPAKITTDTRMHEKVCYL